MNPSLTLPRHKEHFRSRSGRLVSLRHDGHTYRIKANIRGRLVRRASSDYDKARALALAIVDDLDRGYDPGTTLTSAQRVDYFGATGRLPDGVSLQTAVDFYLKHHCVTSQATIAEVGARLVDELTRARRSSNRIKGVARTVNLLAAKHPGKPIHGITTADLEEYLKTWPEPWTRSYHVEILHRIWSSAVKHGDLPPGIPTASDRVVRIPVEAKDPVLCPFPLLQATLKAATATRPHLVPYIAIGAFSGLRSAEISRLTWADVKLEERIICLPSSVTKTRRRRVVPITDNLYHWLLPFHAAARPKDKVLPSCAHNQFRNLRRENPGLEPLPQNSLRHTCATMLLASGQTPDKVASMLGNSVPVLEAHYKGLATQTEALQHFNLYPEDL